MAEIFHGQCHCGQVKLSAPKPEYLTECNCSMCTKGGALWAYYPGESLSISGETSRYVRADLTEPFLTTHFCPVCGIRTHWTPLTDPPHERMGINTRLFGEEMREGVELRFCDGASWPL